MRRIIVLSAVLLATSVASGQWSEPALVARDSGRDRVTEAAFVCAPGDTLWAFHVRNFGDRNDSLRIRAQWSLGDSWSRQSDLTPTSYCWLGCLNPGVDPQDRLWLSWFHGSYPTCFPPPDTETVYATFRDSTGWQPPHMVVRCRCLAGLQTFAADIDGNWFTGMEWDTVVRAAEDSGFYHQWFWSAMYSKLLGDTWATLKYIGRGSPIRECHHYSPTLVTHPEQGVWSVHNHRWEEGTFHYRVIVSHVTDTVVRLTLFPGRQSCATGDSAGRLWIAYMRDDTLRSVLFADSTVVDSQVISADVLPRGWSTPVVEMCTDPAGLVWALWTNRDTVPVVSYNWGTGWSVPEVVTDSISYHHDILSDSRGRIYVLFQLRDFWYGPVYTTYREYRPGILELASLIAHCRPLTATIVRGVLHLGAGLGHNPNSPGGIGLCPAPCLLDAAGRKVMELHPGANDIRTIPAGVYFICSGQGELNQKVVIER